MSNENTFQYVYSASANLEVLSIRKKYLPHEKTQLEELKEMDARVKSPANSFAYVYGSISAIIMGAGMSLVMTDIGAILGWKVVILPGLLVGVAGMCMALSTYPIYKRLLSIRKKKYAPQILELSEKIINYEVRN